MAMALFHSWPWPHSIHGHGAFHSWPWSCRCRTPITVTVAPPNPWRMPWRIPWRMAYASPSRGFRLNRSIPGMYLSSAKALEGALDIRSGPLERPEPTSGARGSLPLGPEPLEPVFDLPT
jgi:hypothetical protein